MRSPCNPAWLALLCAGCHADVFDADARLSEQISTVVQVDWQPLGGGSAWVEFGSLLAFDRRTPEVADGPGRSAALLLGLRPLEEVQYRVVGLVDGQRIEGRAHSIQTMGLPADIPDPRLLSSDADFDGYVLTTLYAADTWVVLLDSQAQVVWYHRLGEGLTTVSAAQAMGGGALRFLVADEEHAEDAGALSTVSMAGEELGSVGLELAHHDFVQHADGSLAWLAMDLRDTEEWGPVVGDQVLSMDSEGRVSSLFSVWDQLDPDLGDALDSGFYPQGQDWTHGNGLSWDADRETYLLTLGGVDRVLEVDSAGQVLMDMGPDTFEFSPADAGFDDIGYGPHAGRWTEDDALLLFHNTTSGESPYSRVLELDVDSDVAQAELSWSFDAQQQWLTRYMGSAQRLPDGSTFTSWGSAGMLVLVDPKGEASWVASAPTSLGNSTVLDDLYSD